MKVIKYVKFFNAQQAKEFYDFKNVKYEISYTLTWSKQLTF